ncbi:prosaposin-like isoform X2 [Dioscorea cayenensis subsp. rotundata]|uniref:Prosaposin-like isoform X2 n=1 Tax=Dioscorea cayennensis subsp. rotundata TaxID=55577 RepID=A0AB40C0S9_DIOCR|nr:prosaposin-like isoform X2 [Dioscorea cayenensis subsp. rotundata]
MAQKIGVLFLFILAVSYFDVDARGLLASDITEYNIHGSENKLSEAVGNHYQLCTLCEEFTAEATIFLAENKTQTEIIAYFQKACSRLPSLEQQCIILVDFYGSLFFHEISIIRPAVFCQKVDLCEKQSVVLSKSNNTCNLCRQVVDEVLSRLKDPDTQCKRIVLQYGPLILVNGEKFLETNDICSTIHACEPSKVEAVGSTQGAETLLADA